MTGRSPGASPRSRRPRAEKSAALMTPSPLASPPLQLTTAPASASAAATPSPSFNSRPRWSRSAVVTRPSQSASPGNDGMTANAAPMPNRTATARATIKRLLAPHTVLQLTTLHLCPPPALASTLRPSSPEAKTLRNSSSATGEIGARPGPLKQMPCALRAKPAGARQIVAFSTPRPHSVASYGSTICRRSEWHVPC